MAAELLQNSMFLWIYTSQNSITSIFQNIIYALSQNDIIKSASFEEMGVKNTSLFFLYLTIFCIVFSFSYYYFLKWLVKKYPHFKYTYDDLEKMKKEDASSSSQS